MCVSFGCEVFVMVDKSREFWNRKRSFGAGLPNILRSDPLGFAPPLQLSGPLANKLQDNFLQESLLSKQARYIWPQTIGQSNWLTEIAWERNYMSNKHAKSLWKTPGTPNIFMYALLRTRVGTLGWTVKMPTQTWYVRACPCLDVFHSGESCTKKENKKQFCTRRMHSKREQESILSQGQNLFAVSQS